MKKKERIRIPFPTALIMIRDYARVRLGEQIRSVAFIILYLIAFQWLVLGSAPAQAVQIATGVGLFVFGLTFFMEGLLLGLMPLGERVGVHLPQRGGVIAITLFGLLLGIGSTLAEPAVAALRTAGMSVTPWDAPLLYRILELEPDRLVISIGAGVGVAVALGMIRFYFGVSIKTLIYAIIPLLLAATALCALDPSLGPILGLAWDAGAVTTGAVTVPLVLALGIGVSRASGRQEGPASGFGIVMLASAFPVLGVIVLGVLLNGSTPRPLPEADFFSAPNRAAALQLAGSEAALRRLAFQRGGGEARAALFENPEAHERVIRSLSDPSIRYDLLGRRPLHEWVQHRASDAERLWIPSEALHSGLPADTVHLDAVDVLRGETRLALRAVLPLTFLLLIVLLAILREIPRKIDEVLLGIFFALIGMTLLTGGIRLGVSPLGDQIGRPLPRLFRSVTVEEGRIVIEPFDFERVLTAYSHDGEPVRFFYIEERDGVPRPVRFDSQQFDPERSRYEHILKRPPLFGPQLTLAGIGLVFLFAFGMGYGSTLAEPALNALGRTVEELTVGSIKGRGVIRAVSFGVGFGLVVGVARILYDIPLAWLLLPPYLLLLPLTAFSEEDFSGIAWDCGGVTTGSVTVPLVLAMGLGIGGELNVTDGFGILAMASVYPILAVLLYGLVIRRRERRSFQTSSAGESDHET